MIRLALGALRALLSIIAAFAWGNSRAKRKAAEKRTQDAEIANEVRNEILERDDDANRDALGEWLRDK